jgi:hypothetical protein
VENRKILVMKIGLSPLGSDTRAVWIDGGIHARLDLVQGDIHTVNKKALRPGKWWYNKASIPR